MIKSLSLHRSSDNKKTLLVEKLIALLKTLPIICDNTYQDRLFKAFSAFAAMLKISEITVDYLD